MQNATCLGTIRQRCSQNQNLRTALMINTVQTQQRQCVTQEMHKDMMREHTSSSHNTEITVIFMVIKPPWKHSRFVFFFPFKYDLTPRVGGMTEQVRKRLASKSGSVKKNIYLVYDCLRLSIFKVAYRKLLVGQSNLGNTATVNQIHIIQLPHWGD